LCQNYLAPRGIDYLSYDPLIGKDIAGLIDARTKLVWMESPGSTTMEFQDVPGIVAAAKAQGVLTGCDNTWATPLLFKPLMHGVDFSMEALTKYVGGHSDLLLGSISVKDIAKHRALKDTTRMLGIGVSPDDCALALRGLQTMGVRLAHIGKVATDLAQRLVGRAGIEQVLHPALPDCPGHAFWKRDFAGASGVFSVILAPHSEQRLESALSKLKVFSIGASWGGARSLIAPMSVKEDREVRKVPGDPNILRISIGLEDPEDLWNDLDAAFTALAADTTD
jgi:cystathionine beta-lyase